MIKKFVLLVAVLASLVIMSCSEDKSSEPTVNDSQALQGEMTGIAEDVMASKGFVAYNSNSQAMDYLPFSMPVKSVDNALENISSANGLNKAGFLKEIFPQTEVMSKQVDHFVFADHLGTYTCDYVEYITVNGVQYVDSAHFNWTSGTNITVIIPAAYTADGKEFKLVLNNYVDEFIYWYDSDQTYRSDYYPTRIDMEIYLNTTEKVFDLDFTADWEYMAAMEDVMPKLLDFLFDLAPYSVQITYTNSVAEILNYSMIMKENLVTLMSIYASIEFVDATLAELKEIDFSYNFGNYSIDSWANVITLEEMLDSTVYTIDQKVEYMNSGDYLWSKIYEGDALIAQLKARKVWDDEYSEYVIETYFEFTDGSQLVIDMDDFENMTF